MFTAHMACPLAAAAFTWGWLWIFVFCALIALVMGGIILLVVWLTGGLGGRN